VGRMEARLDSPQVARRRLAAATVSVNRALASYIDGLSMLRRA
jgi:hypothetical protein